MDDSQIVITDAMRRAVLNDLCCRAAHNFEIIIDGTGEPVDLICLQCGKRWPVVPCDRT